MDDDEDTEFGAPEETPSEQGRRVKSSSLLWFISSRSYVAMPDIRRRFGLYTDSGALLHDEEGPVHIGLPRQAAETLLDLKRRNKIDLQYDLEYATRIAVGVFPLRVRLPPLVAPTRPAPLTPQPREPIIAAVEEPPEEDGDDVPETGATVERPSSRARRRRKRR